MPPSDSELLRTYRSRLDMDMDVSWRAIEEFAREGMLSRTFEEHERPARPKKSLKKERKEKSFVLCIDENNNNKITLRTLRQINSKRKQIKKPNSTEAFIV